MSALAWSGLHILEGAVTVYVLYLLARLNDERIPLGEAVFFLIFWPAFWLLLPLGAITFAAQDRRERRAQQVLAAVKEGAATGEEIAVFSGLPECQVRALVAELGARRELVKLQEERWALPS